MAGIVIVLYNPLISFLFGIDQNKCAFEILNLIACCITLYMYMNQGYIQNFH